MSKYILTAMVLICIFFFVLPEPNEEIDKEKQLNKSNNIKQDHQTDNKFLVKPGVITDFNHSIKETAFGIAIISTTDKIAGGFSTVSLSHVAKNESDYALSVKGEVKSGFMLPWSGISFIPVQQQNQAANLKYIISLNFDAKAMKSANEISILLFEKDSFQPKEIKVPLNNQWQNYQINLSEFRNAELSEISNISFVVSQTIGDFEFIIDNIEFK